MRWAASSSRDGTSLEGRHGTNYVPSEVSGRHQTMLGEPRYIHITTKRAIHRGFSTGRRYRNRLTESQLTIDQVARCPGAVTSERPRSASTRLASQSDWYPVLGVLSDHECFRAETLRWK